MILEGTNVEIPDNLIVEGDLSVWGTNLRSLPAGLSVGGNLDLRGTNISELPVGLSVGGNLDLYGTEVTELPDGFTIGGNLYLYGTEITELPAGLSVGGLYAAPGRLIASESVQLEWIAKGDDMLRVFKSPTEKASLLHEMLWEI